MYCDDCFKTYKYSPQGLIEEFSLGKILDLIEYFENQLIKIPLDRSISRSELEGVISLLRESISKFSKPINPDIDCEHTR